MTLSTGDATLARTDPTVDLSKIGVVGCDRVKFDPRDMLMYACAIVVCN